MDTKLTLKLDKYVIDKAKEYAASQKRSLSHSNTCTCLVINYRTFWISPMSERL